MIDNAASDGFRWNVEHREKGLSEDYQISHVCREQLAHENARHDVHSCFWSAGPLGLTFHQDLHSL